MMFIQLGIVITSTHISAFKLECLPCIFNVIFESLVFNSITLLFVKHIFLLVLWFFLSPALFERKVLLFYFICATTLLAVSSCFSQVNILGFEMFDFYFFTMLLINAKLIFIFSQWQLISYSFHNYIKALYFPIPFSISWSHEAISITILLPEGQCLFQYSLLVLLQNSHCFPE